MGSKADEAIPYCEKAIMICKSRVDRLRKEVNSKSDEGALSVIDHVNIQPTVIPQSGNDSSDKEVEIETMTGLTSELEKKASSKSSLNQ